MKNNNNKNNTNNISNNINVKDLEVEIKSIENRMGRLFENGDFKRLFKLGARLDQINDMIAQLRKEGAKKAAPEFRKSYGFENWCDSLAMCHVKQSYL